MTSYWNIEREERWRLVKSLMAAKAYKEVVVDATSKQIEDGHQGKLERKEVARKDEMSKSINRALDFAKFGSEHECKTVGALRKALKKGRGKQLKSEEERLQVLQMQIKIRKYVYRIFRPVKGAWLSGKKSELLAKVGELTELVEEMIREEQKDVSIGGLRRRPSVEAAPGRAANPHADSLTLQLDKQYEVEVEIAQKLVATLVAQGQFRAPRAGRPQQKARARRRGGAAVRKEATEAEQELVAEDAQFEDDGTLWQVYTTRWEPGHGVTLLYYDVDRIRSRLDDVGDDLEDPEDLLSDDDDVERSSPTEVRAWVDEYQTQAQAQA